MRTPVVSKPLQSSSRSRAPSCSQAALLPCALSSQHTGFTRTAKPSDIKRWRESELTHGRVAMLAAVGFVVGEQVGRPAAACALGCCVPAWWCSLR